MATVHLASLEARTLRSQSSCGEPGPHPPTGQQRLLSTMTCHDPSV